MHYGSYSNLFALDRNLSISSAQPPATLLFLAIVSGALGKKAGIIGIVWMTVIFLFITLLKFFFICDVYDFFNNLILYFKTKPFWFHININPINFVLKYDQLSITLSIIIFLLSFIIFFFSSSYMKDDPRFTAFFSYLLFFAFSMLILVSSNNFIVMFLGWEGVGICSFLLIGFWTMRPQAIKSALKAVVINKIGDILLLLGIVSLVITSNTLNPELIILNSGRDGSGFLFFIGAIAKSAQFGLHIWLPDAMEGPTPVSALLHSATMVTAGIYMYLRYETILNVYDNLTVLICSLSATAAGITSLVQADIKRSTAYSTVSQIGLMFLSAGLLNYDLALDHLTAHAFAKTTIFLTIASVLHCLGDEQNTSIKTTNFDLSYKKNITIIHIKKSTKTKKNTIFTTFLGPGHEDSITGATLAMSGVIGNICASSKDCILEVNQVVDGLPILFLSSLFVEFASSPSYEGDDESANNQFPVQKRKKPAKTISVVF